MVDNVSPSQAWEALSQDPEAQLVDVRTEAEWAFVGVPDVSAIGKEPVLVPWQFYPGMEVNAAFLDELRNAGVRPTQSLFFICRSGGRSMAAAQIASRAGYPNSFNVAHGFEGPPDSEGHRGTVAGWKAEGLPWRQR
jgi:rhodanese-related sulfurtransferase